ncbi:hypothetical protein N599_10115 [Saccharopolyspora erythraea D]|nr:hypothetical protein N599_10115 [Saccharopolyspora erythraea D]
MLLALLSKLTFHARQAEPVVAAGERELWLDPAALDPAGDRARRHGESFRDVACGQQRLLGHTMTLIRPSDASICLVA